MAKGAIRIDWYPGDALDGMKFLTPVEELSYRRILDLLYTSGGELPDDDDIMAEQTRAFKDWKKVKSSLVRKGKIQISDGRITNEKATEVLTNIERKIEKARESGKASGAARRQILPTKTERTLNEGSNERSTNATTTASTPGELSQVVNKLDTADDSACASDWPENPIEDLVAECGMQRGEWQGHTANVLLGWKNSGLSYRLDVLPTVKGIWGRMRGPPKSWRYFTDAIAQAHADRKAGIPIPEPSNPHERRNDNRPERGAGRSTDYLRIAVDLDNQRRNA